jgi:hypothetical protein
MKRSSLNIKRFCNFAGLKNPTGHCFQLRLEQKANTRGREYQQGESHHEILLWTAASRLTLSLSMCPISYLIFSAAVKLFVFSTDALSRKSLFL